MRTFIVIVMTAGLLAASASDAQTFKTLHSFCPDDTCSDGANPLQSPLIKDAAGNFYGTAQNFGARGGGVLFELAGDDKFKDVFDFPAGTWPFGPLIQDVDGNLFGLGSGSDGDGLVFRLHPNKRKTKWSYQQIYTFCPGDVGCTDPHVLMNLTYVGAASGVPYDGKSPLYGSSQFGGTGLNSLGTVFQLSLKRGVWSEKVIYSFCSAGCVDGMIPSYGLIADAAGNLYGTTSGGGQSGNGATFRLAPNARHTKWKETVLHSFCAEQQCHDGSIPSGLVLDGNGNLYGTAAHGGEGSAGVIYRIDSGGQFTRLYAFCHLANCADGDVPQTPMIVSPSGLLYGVTAQDSRVFSFDPSTSAYNVLHTFCGGGDCSDGTAPQSPLTLDESGALYGTTTMAGTEFSGGTVFKLTP
jgi:uncharacterized repeat protein (TIGR03803 family)